VDRRLINRAFLAMAVGAGLDSAILDPLDTELMDTLIAAEMLMNRAIYSDSFLKAYRQ
jgi:5-methyltetrahydrofolate corrinoid/iron sulfur protein methyltransferase